MEARLRRLLEAVEMLNQGGELPFQTRVMRACQHLLPDNYSSLELWDRATGALMAAYDVPHDTQGWEERMKRIGEMVKLEHPGFPLLEAGMTEIVRLSELTTQREFQKTELYEIAFKPADIRHQVVLPLLTPEHLGGVTLNRSGNRDFSPEELELVRLFGRHLVIALENEMTLKRALGQQPEVAAADHLPLRRAGLTRRESEVFLWMTRGKRDREIATILGVSYRTVTNHVYSILKKLGVETRTAAVGTMPEK